MNEVELFLTDEFVDFSTKMAQIHTVLKEKNEVVKKVLETYKEEKSKLEQEAKTLLNNWENKKNKTKKNGE